MGELDRLQIPAMKLKELLTSETEKYLNYWYAIQDSEDHAMAMDLMNKLISEHPGKESYIGFDFKRWTCLGNKMWFNTGTIMVYQNTDATEKDSLMPTTTGFERVYWLSVKK